MKRKVFDAVVMGDFNARIGLGAEDHPNSNGKRLLDLVKSDNFVVRNKYSTGVCKWSWESGRRSR